MNKKVNKRFRDNQKVLSEVFSGCYFLLTDETAGAHISDVLGNVLYTRNKDGDYRPSRRDLQDSESDDSDNGDFMEVLRRTGSSGREPTRTICEEPSRSSRYYRLRLATEGRHRGRRGTTSGRVNFASVKSFTPKKKCRTPFTTGKNWDQLSAFTIATLSLTGKERDVRSSK